MMLSFTSFKASAREPAWSRTGRAWVYADKYRLTNISGSPDRPKWTVGSGNFFRSKDEAEWFAYRLYCRDYRRVHPEAVTRDYGLAAPIFIEYDDDDYDWEGR